MTAAAWPSVAAAETTLRVMLGERSRRAALLSPPTFSSDQQERFFYSQAPEILYSGAMGAGKSRIVCEKAWHLALRYPGCTIGIFRKVRASIKATTLRTFETEVVKPDLVAARNKDEGWFDLVGGSRIYFLGLDPDPVTNVPSKVGSLNLACAFVDEAVELGEDDWTMLEGRLRDPHMPWHQLGAATNPGPPRHWLKLRFTPPTPDREYLHATAADNRMLPEDYQARIRALPDTAAGRRLGRGEWAAAEGAIYDFPQAQIRPPEQSAWKRVVAGIDWGYVHAFACEVIGESSTGRRAVIDELYVHGMTVHELIPALHDLRAAYGIGRFYGDPSEPAYIEECRRGIPERQIPGLPIVAARNDVGPGIEAVARSIKAGMTISPECGGLLTELPGYTWAPQKGGGFKEAPIEKNDDACDALRYAVMGLEPDPSNPWAALAGQSVSGVA